MKESLLIVAQYYSQVSSRCGQIARENARDSKCYITFKQYHWGEIQRGSVPLANDPERRVELAEQIRQRAVMTKSDYVAIAYESLFPAGRDISKALQEMRARGNEHPIFIHAYDPVAKALKRQGISRIIVLGDRSQMELKDAKRFFSRRHGIQLARYKRCSHLNANAELIYEIILELRELQRTDYMSREIVERYVKNVLKEEKHRKAGAVVILDADLAKLMKIAGVETIAGLPVFDAWEMFYDELASVIRGK
ncbi:MAG: hypothetical protein K5837_04160 [Candidatus Saccharibacteria bacterium]|nr:hypothetical protein [Candidatus Saccharibacteria bacterium]